MQNRLFRKEALERLFSPEELDQLLRVTSPRAWLAFVGIVLIIAAVIAWSFFGTITTTVTGSGILIRGGGIASIVAPVSGQISDVYVEAGETIQEGQVVARVFNPQTNENERVISNVSGRVLAVGVSSGSNIELGSTILSIEPQGPQIKDLEVIIYVSPTDSKTISAGMVVQILPATVRREEVGYMLGRVIAVGEFPESEQSMLRVLGSSELVQAFMGDSAPVQVRVDLIPAEDTPSGYRWSTRSGSPDRIQSGTLCDAIIQIGEQRPIELIFPTLFTTTAAASTDVIQP